MPFTLRPTTLAIFSSNVSNACPFPPRTPRTGRRIGLAHHHLLPAVLPTCRVTATRIRPLPISILLSSNKHNKFSSRTVSLGASLARVGIKLTKFGFVAKRTSKLWKQTLVVLRRRAATRAREWSPSQANRTVSSLLYSCCLRCVPLDPMIVQCELTMHSQRLEMEKEKQQQLQTQPR